MYVCEHLLWEEFVDSRHPGRQAHSDVLLLQYFVCVECFSLVHSTLLEDARARGGLFVVRRIKRRVFWVLF